MEGSVLTESLVSCVLLAKQDEEIASTLISDYLPFIKSEINKTIYQKMSDDYVSIGMMAFYEAITKYDQSTGNFFIVNLITH